jgi:hypothetical protein
MTSWSYSGSPGTSKRDEVRFLIGDTESGMACTLSNEEIDWIVNEQGNVLIAAANACEALRAKAIGLQEYEKSDRLKGICSELRQRVASGG